jgi:radical SAM superfamily enzyme YgiQ (UPF0313 family)
MKVLMISTNTNRQPLPVLPFGACLVADAAADAGHNVHFLDLMFQRFPTSSLSRTIDTLQPEVIGISVRNIDNNDMKHPVAFYTQLEPLMDTIRRKTSAPVVLGGAAVGLMPREYLSVTRATCAVAGNGETVFPRLLNAFRRGTSLKEIPGVVEENSSMLNREKAVAVMSDKCHVRDFSRWVDLRRYLSLMASVPLQSKRGCPFDCVYCTYPVSEGRTYQLRNPERVADEIVRLSAQGIQDIEFVDNVFNSPYDHALAICDAIARRAAGVRLLTMELNPRFVTSQLLSSMSAAGFCGIGITAESASDSVLRHLGKNYTGRDVHRCAEMVREHSLPCFWMFMLGGPGETRDTVFQTLQFAEKHVRPTDIAFFNAGIRIYPGTALEARAREEGILTVPRDRMLDPVMYFSKKIDATWLTQMLKRYCVSHMNFICADTLSISFLSQLYRACHWLGMRPPVWHHTAKLRRMFRLAGVNV